MSIPLRPLDLSDERYALLRANNDHYMTPGCRNVPIDECVDRACPDPRHVAHVVTDPICTDRACVNWDHYR